MYRPGETVYIKGVFRYYNLLFTNEVKSDNNAPLDWNLMLEEIKQCKHEIKQYEETFTKANAVSFAEIPMDEEEEEEKKESKGVRRSKRARNTVTYASKRTKKEKSLQILVNEKLPPDSITDKVCARVCSCVCVCVCMCVCVCVCVCMCVYFFFPNQFLNLKFRVIFNYFTK